MERCSPLKVVFKNVLFSGTKLFTIIQIFLALAFKWNSVFFIILTDNSAATTKAESSAQRQVILQGDKCK